MVRIGHILSFIDNQCLKLIKLNTNGFTLTGKGFQEIETLLLFYPFTSNLQANKFDINILFKIIK